MAGRFCRLCGLTEPEASLLSDSRCIDNAACARRALVVLATQKGKELAIQSAQERAEVSARWRDAEQKRLALEQAAPEMLKVLEELLPFSLSKPWFDEHNITCYRCLGSFCSCGGWPSAEFRRSARRIIAKAKGATP